MKTTKGLNVLGLQKSFDTAIYAYQGWSGRVRVVEGDPSCDDYAKWDEQGKANDHEYGDINLKDGK
ncbi:hypothetical protein FQV37_2576 [Psychrobacter nivimaris]|uniref:Uncharacterized protein n=1 Tax=Psychrobacter nivimaris TaxID=281738 RepID=A0A6N7C4D9_9GAMM|nr:hypothetical protein [Psychrobacter nivimaris]KAF0569550.1 hypothetical protein FQV37_2576 [Psychrobacter nivimaris]